MAYNANYENVWCPARPQAQYPNYYYIIEVAVREESIDTTNNKSRLYLEADITGNNIYFSGNDDQYLEVYWVDSKNGEQLAATTTLKSINSNQLYQITGYLNDIVHKDDGTLSGYAYTSWGKNGSNSFVPPSTTVRADLTLTTIARKSIPSYTGTPNIGETITIYTNRKSTAFTHTISYKFNNGNVTEIATGVTESTPWLIPTTLYSSIPNDTEGNVTIYCETFNNGVSIGTESISFKVYVNQNSAKTTISNVTYSIDGTTNSKTGVTNKYIKNYSTISVTLGSVVNSCNSPIKSITLFGNNDTTIEEKTYSSSTTSYSNVTFSNKSKLTYDSLKVKAKDTRGIPSDETTVNIQYVNYVPVTTDGNPTIGRTSQTGSVAKITKFKGNFWNHNFGASDNSLTITWKYREVGGSWSSSYTIPAASITKNTNNNTYEITNYTFTANGSSDLFTYTKAYDIAFTVSDSLNTLTDATVYRLSRGIPNFAIFQNLSQVSKDLSVSRDLYNNALDMFNDTSGNDWKAMMTNKLNYCIDNVGTNKNTFEGFINGGWYGIDFGFGFYAKNGNYHQLVWLSRYGMYYCSKDGGNNYDYSKVGKGVRCEINWSTNLNDFKTDGKYAYDRGATNYSNSPSTDGIHILEVTSNGGTDWVIQEDYRLTWGGGSTDKWRRMYSPANGGTWSNWQYVSDIQCVNLYNDTNGSTTSVTLNQSAANFNYLEIHYKVLNMYYSTRVYSPNGKLVGLFGVTNEQTLMQIGSATAGINGTTINISNAQMSNIGSGSCANWNASNISIVRVDGYK